MRRRLLHFRLLNHQLPNLNQLPNHNDHRRENDPPDHCFHEHSTPMLVTQTWWKQGRAQQPTPRMKQPRIQYDDDFDERPEP